MCYLLWLCDTAAVDMLAVHTFEIKIVEICYQGSDMRVETDSTDAKNFARFFPFWQKMSILKFDW